MVFASLRPVAIALTAAIALGSGAAAAQESALDRKAVEQIVRDYILSNPEIITEAIQVLQQREEERAARAVTDAIAANRAELFQSKTSPVIGNPLGDITLVEFSDYQCGFCKRAKPELAAALAKDPNVRVVIKEFPILGPASVQAARAALAARRQGKYAEMHDALYAHQGPLNIEAIRSIAKKVGLDVAKLEKDMESDAVSSEIDANMSLARALRIEGTPGFVIGETLVPGMIGTDAFLQLFQAQRARQKS